ncbi:MAG: hypothetical protein EB127_11355 [Alphaproteobacteria bacterium]|nr:hypothetical protein [Alphaproteobacteria bacterium]
MKFNKLVESIVENVEGIKNELPETVTISKKEYDQLLKDARLLAFLEATGVENWDGWDFAVQEMEKEA